MEEYPWNWDHDGRSQRLGWQGQHSDSGYRHGQVRLGQGNFFFKMMIFLWFKNGVTPQDRECVQLDLQQALVCQPISIKGVHVRATLELVSEKRPWNKAQAIFICAMRQHANLPRDTFDIRWVQTGLRVSVNMPSPDCLTAVLTQIATFTIGTTCVLDQERFKILAPRMDVEALQTILSDA